MEIVRKTKIDDGFERLLHDCKSINEKTIRTMCTLIMSAQHFIGNREINVEKIYSNQIQVVKKQMENENIRAIVFELSLKSDLLKSIFFNNN